MTYRIAIGTLDGIAVTEHFGRCTLAALWDIDQETDETIALGVRPLSPSSENGCGGGHDPQAVARKISALADCHVVMMAKIGSQAEKQLIHSNIVPLQYEGSLDEAMRRVRRAYSRRVFSKPPNDFAS
ncbi:MAG: hypothetical protein LBB86_07585 [Oscillospiraceae bacterium]|jgi:hypothetical protein|nr:hypothetical protein [Oscillospiraceae bacterium]